MSTLSNHITLIGRLGNKPEVFHLGAKQPFAKLSLATNKVWKKDDQQQEHTDWHTIVVYRPYYIELAKEHLNKGEKLLIEGELRTRKWQTKKGEKRLSVFIVAHRLWPMGSKQNESSLSPGFESTSESEEAEALSDVDELVSNDTFHDEAEISSC